MASNGIPAETNLPSTPTGLIAFEKKKRKKAARKAEREEKKKARAAKATEKDDWFQTPAPPDYIDI